MEVKLTKEEQAKYDEVYTKITSQYNAEDLATLEADGVAKYYLKQIILKYVFTGEFPKDFNAKPLKNTSLQEEVHYDATMPLQEGKEPLINSVETICNNMNPDVDVQDIISSLNIERTKSDELDKSIQDE
jgi:hypothetical protein